jgi:hypothetical protein
MKKLLTIILILLSINAFSQAEDPADGDGTVPVDGGLSLLLATGVVYSLRTLRNREREM